MYVARRLAAACLIVACLAASGAGADAICRTDALGNPVCREQPPRSRPPDLEVPGADRQAWTVEPAPAGPSFVPARRRSVLGDTIVPDTRPPGGPGFGERPRPRGPATQLCRSDQLGNLVCR